MENNFLKNISKKSSIFVYKFSSMANNHFEKWILKTPLGFLLVAGGIFFMYYSIAQLPYKENWILYGVISALSAAIGVYILCDAAVHKMKSDLIKKQKIRQQSGV